MHDAICRHSIPKDLFMYHQFSIHSTHLIEAHVAYMDPAILNMQQRNRSRRTWSRLKCRMGRGGKASVTALLYEEKLTTFQDLGTFTGWLPLVSPQSRHRQSFKSGG
jgi:hypothetical protein